MVTALLVLLHRYHALIGIRARRFGWREKKEKGMRRSKKCVPTELSRAEQSR